ncbi:Glycosyltransferase involved in cell wall bisynthesis [Lachnospiraceae bacterium]|nr:Glycosyltransferase involved in cell wall bisynthesis [Lachnospiraceae bacterium]
MVFVTLFTRLENVHLLKDVGMIPYILNRDYGVESILVSARNEADYPYIRNEVKGLKMRFLPKNSVSPMIPAMKYVWDNAADIDVLNVYHLNLSSFLYLLIYKLRKSPSGKGYLKLDMDLKGYRRLFMKNPVGLIKRLTMRLADVISVETTVLSKKLRMKYGQKVLYIPNGFYASKPVDDFHKENVILTVGALGTYAKATDTLLRAFAGAAAGNDWKLELVGPIAPDFKPFIRDFMAKHQDLKDRIKFTGEIRDKEKLAEIYRKAKIFVLPSRSESFGIVLLEAAASGDFLITTTGVPAGRDIYNDGKFGFIVPPDDIPALSGSFVRLMNSSADWDSRAREIADYAWHDFRWEPIVAKLHEVLNR